MIKTLFSPVVFFIAGLFILWLLREKKRTFKIFGAALGILVFIVCVSPLPYWLAEMNERAYPAFELRNYPELRTDEPVHVVVLGSGYTNDPELSVTSQLGKYITQRLVEGIRIYRLFDNAKLVTSGAAPGASSRSQAEAVADAAVALGVAPEDTLWLSNTLNTEGEAREYAKRMDYSAERHALGEKYNLKNRVILVTSAIHMKRAVFWFNHFGVEVIPAPCEYIYKYDPEDPDFEWLPSYNKVRAMDRVMDEWLGRVWGVVKTNYKL